MEKLKQLTSEQLDFLKQFEDNFRTATEGSWARQRPVGADQKMVAILEYVTGKPYPFHAGCRRCEINLLRDIEKIYSPAKLAAEEAEAAAKKAAAQEATVKVEEVMPAIAKTTKAKKLCKKNDKK